LLALSWRAGVSAAGSAIYAKTGPDMLPASIQDVTLLFDHCRSAQLEGLFQPEMC
jgi:hypothetical protein